jgi:tartrate-resistant acid phosphatase type 5
LLSFLPLSFSGLITADVLSSFIIIGDAGNLNGYLQNIAESMRELCSLTEPNFVMSLGDNFYEKGPDNSRKIKTVWRDVFIQGSMSDIVWHQVLGNEDWFGDINLADAQMNTLVRTACGISQISSTLTV